MPITEGGVDHTDCKMLYDFSNNVFYSFKHSNSSLTRLESFTISNFNKGGVSFGFVKEHLSKRIAQFKQVVFGGENALLDGGKPAPNKLNLI